MDATMVEEGVLLLNNRSGRHGWFSVEDVSHSIATVNAR
jgi:hypothetical protein